MRKYLRNRFEELDFSAGLHRWEIGRWYEEVKKFLREELKIVSFSEKNVFACILLVYPALGKTKMFTAHEEILEHLDEY